MQILWKSSRLPVASQFYPRRLFSAISSVKLAYDEHIPPSGNRTNSPLVILHGLFGSKRNWQSLSKAFARDLGRPVYALDLRNHGVSPNVRPMTYVHMAGDVLAFMRNLSLSNVSLLGHSMGGKVAMCLALHPEMPSDVLAKLIVSDIAPVRGKVSEDTVRHLSGMERIESSGITTRKEADQILEEYEKDPTTRAFLLTNLDSSSKSSTLGFRVPIDILREGRPEMESFPWAPGERSFEGHSLFVKGTKSRYINKHNIPTIKEFFPAATIRELNAGHWVHAERPNEFKNLVMEYILDETH